MEPARTKKPPLGDNDGSTHHSSRGYCARSIGSYPREVNALVVAREAEPAGLVILRMDRP